MNSFVPFKEIAVPEFLSGGGEMGQRIREYNWHDTRLGPVENWPQNLRTCIRIMLTSRQPMWIGWGKDLIKFYNDPYKAIVGGKHPQALGQPASVVWKDIWKDIEMMLKQVMEKDEGTYVESQLLIMERNGYPEETYYTFSYTPIPGDDGGTAGMICANTDDTERIISERQLLSLTKLGKALIGSKKPQDVFDRTIATITENSHDFPFALLYKLDGSIAHRAHTTGIEQMLDGFPVQVDMNANDELCRLLCVAGIEKKAQVMEGLSKKMGKLPSGAWPTSPDSAIILPITQSFHKDTCVFLVIGLNPYRLPDEKYIGFFGLIADQVARNLTSVHTIEEERKRAEALAEIDKAKTNFFSNISHEFRTPLTLILGPIEDALNDPDTLPKNRIHLDTAYRNAIRMQKLVNTLLEFSRIEAGRLQASFRRVDISSFTRDLASSFRSAIEKAGMEFIINAQKITQPVYVDVDMWEKIVLNLLSNAFKYSTAGKIEVTIQQAAGNIELAVTDTGIGIPASDSDKIFDRFHRVQNTQGRSQEGTGIGLALVKELVKLHHGTINVSSEPGKGSTFTITIPVGKDHLPDDKVIAGVIDNGLSGASQAYIDEAIKWLPENGNSDTLPDNQHLSLNVLNDNEKVGQKSTVLVVDDNADMREYIGRLLVPEYNVLTSTNGEDAFAKAVKHNPDLILSDIMMPRLDGFGLLKKIRNHPATKKIPLIFLSARSGEEAKVEGLDAGADDYLVKPFSAKELMVRVANHIRINRVRRETEQQFYRFFLQAPALIHVMKGPDHIFEFFHPQGKELVGGRDLTGLSVREALPEFEGQGFFELLDEVYQQGITIALSGRRSLLKNKDGELIERFFDFTYQPLYDERRKIEGVLNFAVEVTDKVRAKMRIEESESYFRRMADTLPATIRITDKDGICTYLNKQWYEYTGQTPGEALGDGWLDATHPEDMENAKKIFFEAINKQSPFSILYRLKNSKGKYRWALDSGAPRFNAEGNFEGFIGSVIDVHEERLARDALHESREMFSAVADFAYVGIVTIDLEGRFTYANQAYLRIVGYTQSELESISLQDLTHPDDYPATQSKLQELINGGVPGFTITKRYIRKNKSIVWVNNSVSAIKNQNGTTVSIMAVSQDITDRIEVEQELLMSEERFRMLATTIPQIVWTSNPDGSNDYMSDQWMQYTGQDPKEGLVDWAGFIHPDDLSMVAHEWNESVKKGLPWKAEYRLKNKKGEYRWFTGYTQPLKNDEGRIIKWIGASTDIHALKEQSALLEQIVQERTKALNESTRALQQSNEDLQQFAHVASHDLKEPLRKIIIFGGRLQQDEQTVLSENGKIYLGKMQGATERMFSMIDGVLTYSTINASEQKIEWISLKKILAEIETDLELLIQQKNALISYGDLPEIEGANVLIYQLFYNLINNSLKFTKENVQPHISISFVPVMSKGENCVNIVVSDNGIGFREDQSERIFNTFARLNSKDKFEGTGLGLALCKKIVQRHNGFISAKGIENEGAVFSIALPVWQKHQKV